LSVSRDRASHFSGQPAPVPHHLHCRRLKAPLFKYETISLVLSQQSLLKSLSPSFLQPLFRYRKAALRSPRSSLHAEQPQLLNLSSEKCSVPWIIFVALKVLCSKLKTQKIHVLISQPKEKMRLR